MLRTSASLQNISRVVDSNLKLTHEDSSLAPCPGNQGRLFISHTVLSLKKKNLSDPLHTQQNKTLTYQCNRRDGDAAGSQDSTNTCILLAKSHRCLDHRGWMKRSTRLLLRIKREGRVRRNVSVLLSCKSIQISCSS